MESLVLYLQNRKILKKLKKLKKVMSQHYEEMKAQLEKITADNQELLATNETLVAGQQNIKDDITRILQGQEPTTGALTEEEVTSLKGLIDGAAAAANAAKEAINKTASDQTVLADENKAPGEGEAAPGGEVAPGETTDSGGLAVQ